MFYSDPSHTPERGFPVTVRHAEPCRGEKLGRSVRRALLLAVALHPHERTGGGEESAGRSGAQGAGGRSRELPVRLHSRGG